MTVTSSHDGSGFEIRIWPTAERRQPELSFGLDDCGTGVAQVISILTVALTFKSAVIVIDEINSFLHPSAAKALLRILQTHYEQHQYIVVSHAPEVLSSANPSTVHLVQKQRYTSTVRAVDLKKFDELREVAGQLGVSMTDVFARDRIVWVEGQTEELCFPFVHTEALGGMPSELLMTALVATGDFNLKSRQRKLTFQIYKKLSDAAAPLVKAIAFSFDMEDLSESQMTSLTAEADGKLLFLPRRNFECFLIEPAAIAALIHEHVPDLEGQVTPNEVLNTLAAKGVDDEFHAKLFWKDEIRDPAWLAKVDGAKLIKAVCGELTQHRLLFAKKNHSLYLLKHIMANNRDQLVDLIEYVKRLVELVHPDKK